METRKSIYSLVETIRGSYPRDTVRIAFSLFLKLIENILENPYEPKFRYFKLSNEAVKSKILVIPEMIILAKEIGFEQEDKLHLVYNQYTLDNLLLVINALTPIVDLMEDNLRLKSYEKINPEVLKHQKELEIKMQEEKEARLAVLNQIENDKIERSKKARSGPSIATFSSKKGEHKKFKPNNNLK